MDEVKGRFVRAFSGEEPGAFISFLSSEALWKTLTAKRWQLLKALTGAGPVSIREAARRVGRDVKAVHRDVHALLNAGAPVYPSMERALNALAKMVGHLEYLKSRGIVPEPIGERCVVTQY